MKDELEIIPSKYAKPLFTETFYEADIWGGRGRGGSHNMTLYTVLSMMTSNYFRGYFVRAIQGTVRDSLWQDFKDRITEVSELNNYDLLQDFKLIDTDMTAVYLPNGNTVKSKGFKASSKSNTANMKSIAGATHVMIEECEEVGREEYNKLADSLRTIKAPVKIIRSWNAPPKDHWLVSDYFNLEKSEYEGYYKLTPKELLNHLSMFGTYKDNIKNLDLNTIARYKRYKETSPRYYYNQILGLVSDGGDSKVYYGWKKVSIEEFNKIDGVEAYGVDFGDTAPTTLVHVKYKDGCFYRRELMYKPLRVLNLKHKEYLQKIRNDIQSQPEDEQNNIWSKHRGLISFVFDEMNVDKDISMYCDPAQKGLIIELRQAGYNAIGAKKDKAANINFINRAVNFYTDDSANMETEYNKYYLETDVNKVPIDGKPIKGNDHLMEGQEYACRGLKDEYGIIL
jgi:phage terminase large subunit